MPAFIATARARLALPAALTALLLAAGCGAASTGSAAAAGGAGAVSTAASSGSGEVTVTDPWVRATKGIADPTMTTVFGEFTNHTGHDLTIVSATNTLTSRTELHQMTMNGDVMVMGTAAAGIRIPANSSASLDPNSAHIMIMGLKSPIQPGDEVTVTAKLDDGSTVMFQALGKDYAGGNESYPSGSGAAPTSMAPGMTMPSATRSGMSGATRSGMSAAMRSTGMGTAPGSSRG